MDLRDLNDAQRRAVTTTERQTILKLYAEGWALDEIGSEIRRGHPVVRKALVAAGVQIRPKGGRKPRARKIVYPVRSRGRSPEGYNLELEQQQAASLAALNEALRLPDWMLALPTSEHSLEDLCR